MALDAEQQRVLRRLLDKGRKRGMTTTEILSAVETGIVEQSLHNRPGGGGGSAGWRQEIPGSYPGKDRLDLNASIDRYYNEVKALRGRHLRSGALAAAVQRPEYRGRYAQHASEALALIRGHGGFGGSPAAGSARRSSGGGARTIARTATVSVPVAPVESAGLGQAPSLAALIAGHAQQPVLPMASALPAPAFSARPRLAGGVSGVVPMVGPPVGAQSDVGAGIAAAQSLEDATLPARLATATSTATGVVPGVPAQKPGKGSGRRGAAPRGHGKLEIAAGANRAGVPMRGQILGFLQDVADHFHHMPVVVGTGTNHNQMTTSGNVSDHWGGNAGDIRVGGRDTRQGDEIAQAALEAAGVSRERAAKMARTNNSAPWNIIVKRPDGRKVRVQIIWRSYVGGDHHNHVHVGVRPA